MTLEDKIIEEDLKIEKAKVELFQKVKSEIDKDKIINAIKKYVTFSPMPVDLYKIIANEILTGGQQYRENENTKTIRVDGVTILPEWVIKQ